MQNFQRRRISPQEELQRLHQMNKIVDEPHIAETSCKTLTWYFRAYVYVIHSFLYEYIQFLRHRARPEDESDGGLPFEAGFPLRILTMTAVFWTIEFLYIRLHIFSIPVVVRGVCYLIFVLTIDMLCYYVYIDLSIGISIEACPFWVIALIAVEKLLIETLIRRLHYCPIGESHIKDDLQLFIEGLMTPPPPGCCGGTHRCDRHRASANNGHRFQPHNHHGHAHMH